MAKQRSPEQAVRTALAVIAEHATAESIFECVEALLELKLGKAAYWIVIDGRGRLPVVRACTVDLCHTMGMLSMSIDVVAERADVDQEDEGEESA